MSKYYSFYDEHIYMEPRYQDGHPTWAWQHLDTLLEKGSLGEFFKMMRRQATQARAAYIENSPSAAELYSPSRLASFTKNEVKALVKWLGQLQPAIAMDMLRKALSSPETLPRETRAAFASVPFVFPQLLFGFNPNREGPRDAVEKIAEFTLRSMRDLGFYPTPLRISYRPEYDGYVSQSIGRYYSNLVPLVQDDLGARVRLFMDIRLRRPSRSFISLLFREGGPKCTRLLADPAILEGAGLGRDSLAAFAVFGRFGDDALTILGCMEDATPGYIGSVKDGAGNNLLWYLALRDRIWAYDKSHRAFESHHPGEISRVRDFLLEAGCDPAAINAFGISWDEARAALKMPGGQRNDRQLTLAV